MNIGTEIGRPPPSRKWGVSDRLANSGVFVGVEIELEAAGRLNEIKGPQKSGLWTIVTDGSLRDGGLEYIMNEAGTGQPLMGADVINALDIFKEAVEELPKNHMPTLGPRTSVHVHIDVRDLSRDELTRFILLYYTFEDIFFSWIGQDRDQSNYCRPASRFPDIIHRAATFVSSDVTLGNAVERTNKYDALNLRAIATHGSVEIRSLAGTLDTDRILLWINILLSIRNAAINPDIDIEQYPETVSAAGLGTFARDIFGEYGIDLEPYLDDASIMAGTRLTQGIMLEAVGSGSPLKTTSNIKSQARLDLFKQTVGGV